MGIFDMSVDEGTKRLQWELSNPGQPYPGDFEALKQRYAGVDTNLNKSNTLNPISKPFNSMLGNADMASIDGAMGYTNEEGMTSSGWLSPAYKGAQSAWNAYQSYNAAKETKKQNKANLSKANEAMYRQGVDQRNKIAGSRRRQGMGLGNANNTGAMAGLVAANPYSEYRNYNIPY